MSLAALAPPGLTNSPFDINMGLFFFFPRACILYFIFRILYLSPSDNRICDTQLRDFTIQIIWPEWCLVDAIWSRQTYHNFYEQMNIHSSFRGMLLYLLWIEDKEPNLLQLKNILQSSRESWEKVRGINQPAFVRTVRAAGSLDNNQPNPATRARPVILSLYTSPSRLFYTPQPKGALLFFPPDNNPFIWVLGLLLRSAPFSSQWIGNSNMRWRTKSPSLRSTSPCIKWKMAPKCPHWNEFVKVYYIIHDHFNPF